MHIFKVGDRIIIQKEYHEFYSVYKGEVCGVPGYHSTFYSVRLDGCSLSCYIPEEQLVLSDSYLDFLDKIKDRM